MRTSVATVGYRFNQNFAVEGGYVDLGKASYSANFTGGNANGPGSSASSTNWKPNFGIGGTYNVDKQLGIRVEYERFSNLGDTNTTGEVNVDLMSAGVVYKF